MENKRNTRNLVIFIILFVTVLVAIDQITKALIVNNIYNLEIKIIDNLLKFTYIENTGGAFGIGQNNTMTFIITNIVVLGIVMRFVIIQKDKLDTKVLISLLMIFAGGVSNLVDRVCRGFVVDFIDITDIFKFPIFNIADVFLVVGWMLLALFITVYTLKSKKRGIL